MDRTVKLTDNWYYYDGNKPKGSVKGFFARKAVFPVSSVSSFTLKRKMICPKQVNDTVTVFFTGEYGKLQLYAKNKLIPPMKDGEGRYVYDITSSLKTGKTVISAVFENGSADGFFLSVKRNLNGK